MKKNLLVIILGVLVILGSASGWVYQYLKSDSQIVSKDEITNLQISFMKNYGASVNVSEVIKPKIYEVAWTDDKGDSNVSMNVGGVWVLIASVAKPATTTPPTTTTP